MSELPTPAPLEPPFAEVLALIAAARQRAYQAVNTSLIDLYWRIGEHISRKIASAEWGAGVVNELARKIAAVYPGQRGFTRSNLLRMRQFHETYRDHAFVAPLVRLLPGEDPQALLPQGGENVVALLRQLPWTHHVTIFGQCKRPEEREFYLRLAIREKWSSRELERQLRAALFERTVLSPPQVSPLLAQMHPDAASVFRDSYLVEFLGLPTTHAEEDLHQGLVRQLREFLIELGRDFCFVGTKFPLQVGGRDFALDLLFFHRGLNCLVAFELKIGRFEPEFLGKLSFYLEAIDRDVRKPHENPAIGVLLCASKDAEVVEYALSRTLTPALIAEYQTQLPDKKLLQQKLHEFYQLNAQQGDQS